MSHLLELAGKTGHICPPGHVRTGGCPMLLRTTSEDVMTSTVVGILKNLTPQKWLGQWLNQSFQTEAFSKAKFDDLSFELWTSLTPPPGLKHREGDSHPDLVISFDDVVIGCEVKYTSPLSGGTSHSGKRNQVIRYIDVFSNHYNAGKLFGRQVYIMTLTLEVPELVNRYRLKELIAKDLVDLGYSRQYADDAANAVTVGASTWQTLAAVLVANLESFAVNSVELAFVLDCVSYIWTKISQAQAITERKL